MSLHEAKMPRLSDKLLEKAEKVRDDLEEKDGQVAKAIKKLIAKKK